MSLKLSEKEFEVESLKYKLDLFSGQISQNETNNKQTNLKMEETTNRVIELSLELQQSDFELRKVKFDCDQSRRITAQKIETEQKLREKITQMEIEFKNKEGNLMKNIQDETSKKTIVDRSSLLERELSAREKEIEKLNREIIEREQSIMGLEQQVCVKETELNSKTNLCQSFEREMTENLRELNEAKLGLVQKKELEKEVESLKKIGNNN